MICLYRKLILYHELRTNLAQEASSSSELPSVLMDNQPCLAEGEATFQREWGYI